MIELCRRNHWDFMIVLQDASLPTLWEEIQGRQQLEHKKLENPKVWSQNWGIRRQRFQWFNDLPYAYVDRPPSGPSSTDCMSSSARKAGKKLTRKAPPWCPRPPVTCGSPRALGPGQCASAL